MLEIVTKEAHSIHTLLAPMAIESIVKLMHQANEISFLRGIGIFKVNIDSSEK